MTWATWTWLATGWAVGIAGAALIAWALFGDALRRLRRGRTRRCPRCWYSMEGIPGRRCPECGREAKRERGLLKPRRRWRWAAFCVIVIVTGFALHATPGVRERGWISLVPDRALVWVYFHDIQLTEEDGIELSNRLERGLISRSVRRAVVTRAIERMWTISPSDVYFVRSFGYDDPRALPAIARAAADAESTDLRTSALEMLYLMPGSAIARLPETRELLTSLATDPSEALLQRGYALVSLAAGFPDDRTRDLLRDFSEDAAVGDMARFALLRVTPDAGEASRLAEELVARQATSAYGAEHTDIMAAICRFDLRGSWVDQFVASEIAAQRIGALFVAATREMDAPVIVDALQALADDEEAPWLRRFVPAALDAICGGEPYLEWLAREFKSGDAEMRQGVMLALYVAYLSEEERAAPVVVALIEAGLRDGDRGVFWWAIRAAAQADPKGQRFGPMIARRKWSFDPQIREMARSKLIELRIWSGWDF